MKKIPLFIRKDDETVIKDLLRSKGLVFWNETGVFRFNLLTAVATSIIWATILIIAL